MKRRISLQSWMRYYWAGMLLFLLVVYALSWFYMRSMLTKKAEEQIQKSVRIVQRDIEDSLEIVDSFVYEALYSGAKQTPSQLYYSLRSEVDPVELLATEHAVLHSMQSIVSWADMVDFVLVCTDRGETLAWLEAGSADSYAARRSIKEQIRKEVAEGESLQRYMICEDGQDSFMLRILKIEDSYIINCVSEDKILQMLEEARYEAGGISFLAETTGSVIAASADVKATLSPEQEGAYVPIGGESYLQTGYVSEQTGYYFGILTRQESILKDMIVFRLLFFTVFFLLMFFLPVMFFVLQFCVTRPIRLVAETMDRIAEGELDITVAERMRFRELERLVSAFNGMISRIRQLKIEKYEGELEVQRATLQYLQLQIRPHFYANMFNIIYSLAQRKDYDTIQRTCKAIVNYSRYMFRDASELVELKRELEHVEAYMEIQNIRYMRQVSWESDVEEDALNALVPPFIIQNYVENSVKYAFNSKKYSRIRILVNTVQEKEYLQIVVRDNGVGYSEEILSAEWKEKNVDGHIGLTNIFRRLKMIYGDRADVELKNENGAVTTVTLPYIVVENILPEMSE